MIGFRTDMNEILQTADVFAFPSIREGLGIAAIEALACGVPPLLQITEEQENICIMIKMD